MARPVYSKRFFRIGGYSGPPFLQFIAPSDFVTVVRTIVITGGSNPLSTEGWVEDQTGAKLAWFHTGGTPTSPPASIVFDVHQVLDPLDELYVASPNTCDFWCSGYLLTP